MADAENALPPSKKRAAGREISKDDPGLDDEEDVEQETGTFKKASDAVMASRKIVKPRRKNTSAAPTSNPFAGICLVPPTQPVPSSVPTSTEVAAEAQTVSKETEKGRDESEKKDEPAAESAPGAEKEKNDQIEASKPLVDDEKVAEGGKTESEDKKDNGNENKDKEDASTEAAPLNSFQQLSSTQNAFTGLAGTGSFPSLFSFGTLPKDGSSSGTSSGSLFGSSGFSFSTNGSSSIFGTPGSSATKAEGTNVPSMQEVPVETGEENEKIAFTADSVLFEFLDGGWKERGKGEVKVNVSTSGNGKARLVMRARGNYRLILNASLYPDMKLTNMEKKGITFACVNCIGEGKEGTLSTFALRFKDGSVVEEFRAAVSVHQGKVASSASDLKTPENSPKASDD